MDSAAGLPVPAGCGRRGPRSRSGREGGPGRAVTPAPDQHRHRHRRRWRRRQASDRGVRQSRPGLTRRHQQPRRPGMSPLIVSSSSASSASARLVTAVWSEVGREAGKEGQPAGHRRGAADKRRPGQERSQQKLCEDCLTHSGTEP